MRNSSKNRRGDPRDIEQPLLQDDILHVRETDIKSASERDEDEEFAGVSAVPASVRKFDFEPWEAKASHPWSESDTDQPEARIPVSSRGSRQMNRGGYTSFAPRAEHGELIDESEQEEHPPSDRDAPASPRAAQIMAPVGSVNGARGVVPSAANVKAMAKVSSRISGDEEADDNQNFPGGVRGRKVRRTLQKKGRIVTRHDMFERVIAYCIAHNFDSDIYEEALDHIWPQCRHAFFDDTLHVVQRSNSEHSDKGDVFLLSLGTVVFWGLTESEEQLCVKRLRGMVERHEWGSDLVLDKDVQSDTLYFGYLDIGKEVTLSKDVIMLPRYQFSKFDVRAKLAVSMAMAQSVKLEYFEQRLDDTVTRTEKIPHDLARFGQVRMRRSQIIKELGQIMVERNRVNLQNTFFDTPNFFWEAENEEFEPVFAKARKYLDISKRLDVLNRKMDILKEVFDLLSETLNNRHSARLEWIVIGLIILECVITVATFLYSEYEQSNRSHNNTMDALAVLVRQLQAQGQLSSSASLPHAQ